MSWHSRGACHCPLGGKLNYYSQMGLELLAGVTAKNGILIVEFANQFRAAGQNIDITIRDAVRLRIRPVMMTMVSTVLGGLPLVLAGGAGAEARAAVGWVIVGGLGAEAAVGRLRQSAPDPGGNQRRKEKGAGQVPRLNRVVSR